MNEFVFPTGSDVALVAKNWSASFDELHDLKNLVARTFLQSAEMRPKRVLGCLKDDETALLALLVVTELTDYMPINPNLSDLEITAIATNSGADYVILSSDYFRDKQHLFHGIARPILNWSDVVATSRESLGSSSPVDAVVEKPPQTAREGRLILHTSGSTGEPKRVPIGIEAINASARNIALGHQLTKTDLALNALPTFHIGALVDVLLAPLSVGGAVCITDQRAPEGLVAALIEKRPTWVQIVPTILRQLVEDISPERLEDAGRSLTFVRSVSAPVPPELKQKAEALLGCPIVEMYGMTETAGQIATNAREHQENRVGSVGKSGAIPVAVFDAFGNLVEPGKTGEICVSGPTVFQGYEGIPKGDVFFEDWFRTGDLGCIDDDGYLYLRGRLKEMINVGGEKVSPFEIETAALLLPEVLEAAAYSMPHTSLGEQVGLTIACKPDTDLAEVMAHLRTHLAPFKCPNKISPVPQLPRLANAKVDRVLLKREAAQALQQRLVGQEKTQGSPVAHSDPTAAKVAGIWTDILKCRSPEGDDDFFDMGGDSLSATQFLLRLQTALGREISPSQLFESPRFDQLVAAVSKPAIGAETGRRDHRALLFIKQRVAGWPGKAPLGSELFRAIGTVHETDPVFWSSQSTEESRIIGDALATARPYYCTSSLFQYPDRSEDDFEVLAGHLAQDINKLQPTGDITLGGFCGGAWVMQFTAERLIEMGRKINVFFSLDHWPERKMPFPVVHGMTNSKKHSVRMQYSQCEKAAKMLHPKGVHIIRIDGPHNFTAADLAPHINTLNRFIDAPPIPEENSTSVKDQERDWCLKQRFTPPSAVLKVQKAPRLFAKDQTAHFQVAVRNASEMAWAPTAQSGLSLEVDLLNLDNFARVQSAGYAEFDDEVAPGQEIVLDFDVQMPTTSMPLWARFILVNQGIKRFSEKLSGPTKRLILPKLL